MSERFDRARQGISRLDERQRIHGAVRQDIDCPFHVAAARADDTHFVNDDWSEIDVELSGDGGFQHDRATRRYEPERGFEAGFGSRGFDNERRAFARCRELALDERVDPCAGRERELVGMPAHEGRCDALAGEGACDEKAELAVAEHDGAHVRRSNLDFVEHVERRGQWFGEHRAIVGEMSGHFDQTSLGNGHELGERTGPARDAQHRPIGTMMTAARPAFVATAAAGVDVGDHALAGPRRIIGSHHVGDELVAGNTTEAHVAARELQVGIANPGHAHAEERLAANARGRWMILVEARRTVEH